LINRKEDITKKAIRNMEIRKKEILKKDIMMKIIKDTNPRKDTSLITQNMRKEARKVESMEEASMAINMVVVTVIINFFSAKQTKLKSTMRLFGRNL
jgi:hypothetical protein